MKSERRHELETNQLAQALAYLPELMRLYGNRILLALVLIALLVAVIGMRVHFNRKAAAEAVNALAFARERLASLQGFQPLAYANPEDRQTTYRQYVQEISDALEQVVRSVDDPVLLADALVARGDLNWTMASYPEQPEATTRPSLALQEDREGPLAVAKQAYEDVLRHYPDNTMAVLSARFGLAAIAENAGDWAAAEQHYQAIVSNQKFHEAFRKQAEQRLKTLDDIRQPVFIADRSSLAAAETAPADVKTPAETPAPSTQPAEDAAAEPAATTQPVE